jgi:outer membrane protein assembly factor BamB
MSLDPDTGAARWRQRPGGPITGIVTGADTVFVSTRGPLFALDRQTGRQRWRATCAWEPELRVYPEAGLLLVDDPETETIRALDVERGTVAWEFAAEGQPVVAGPQSRDLIAISAHGAGVAAVDVATGEPRWRLETGAAFESAGVLIGDTFLATDGTIHAVDARTGEARWTRRLEDEEDGVFTLRALDGELFAETWRGRLLSLDATDGSIRWDRRIGQVHGVTADAEALCLRVLVEEPVARWMVVSLARKSGELQWELNARRQVPDVTRFGDVLVVELKNQVLVLRPQ